MIDVSSKAYNTSANCGEAIETLKAERDLFRDGFLRLYGAITRAYSAKGKDEKRDVEKYARKLEELPPDDRPAFLASMGEGMIEALAEAPVTACALSQEGPDPLRYDRRNLNDRRRDAIVAYMEKTGKATITTQEARHVLQTAENRKLDRKTIWRALKATRDFLGASLDLLGGVLRLVLPTRHPIVSSTPGHQGGSRPSASIRYGSISPRPRRDRVPWDGED